MAAFASSAQDRIWSLEFRRMVKSVSASTLEAYSTRIQGLADDSRTSSHRDVDRLKAGERCVA